MTFERVPDRLAASRFASSHNLLCARVLPQIDRLYARPSCQQSFHKEGSFEKKGACWGRFEKRRIRSDMCGMSPLQSTSTRKVSSKWRNCRGRGEPIICTSLRIFQRPLGLGTRHRQYEISGLQLRTHPHGECCRGRILSIEAKCPMKKVARPTKARQETNGQG